ncbi:hypothetical protein HFP15_35985 [Amycolatopsis sp. K13G38]|uniref:Serine/threonine protein kinase n=1 Tax=Amycolatopsis acididurans TaxID=2724524 RepID=A0ABX1JEZ0_9PSEU|nr:hypothetical protein [Amycolatopsis acididurans]
MVTAVLAVLVTVGALIGVASLRSRDEGGPALQMAAPAVPVTTAEECGSGPCRVLASQTVDGGTVELLADDQGANGQFRAGGVVVQTTITRLGARLDAGSLSCVTASVSACLVTGPLSGGRVGQLMIDRAGTWRSVDKPYFSDAGVLTLNSVSGSGAPEVVVVQNSPVQARVYALDGSSVGCTRHYTYLSQLRGWPNVRLEASDLRAC